jgi:serine/threonine protein kinase
MGINRQPSQLQGKFIGMKPTFPKFSKAGRSYHSLSPLGVNLLESMIQINPLKRISIANALKHPYFYE